MVLSTDVNHHQILNNGFQMANSEEQSTADCEFSASEYFKSLEKWVQDVMLWQHFNYVSFQSFMLNQAVTFRPSGTPASLINYRNVNLSQYQNPTQIRGNIREKNLMIRSVI